MLQSSKPYFHITLKGGVRFILGWLACALLFAAALIVLALAFSFGTWFLAVRGGEAYPSPEAALEGKINQIFTGVERYEVRSMGPNDLSGKQPGVWFVGADVWAAGRSDGRQASTRGYESIGRFLVLTKRGWVFIEEAGWPPLWGSPAD